jgi:DNA-binding transcriptional ArsR family regulator
MKFAYAHSHMNENRSSAAKILKAAGEPTRLRILNLLRLDSICVCDIQALLGIAQPTVSRHLAVLRHTGLVLDDRDGPRVWYSLAPATTPQLEAFHAFLERVCSCEDTLGDDLENFREALGREGVAPRGSRSHSQTTAEVV